MTAPTIIPMIYPIANAFKNKQWISRERKTDNFLRFSDETMATDVFSSNVSENVDFWKLSVVVVVVVVGCGVGIDVGHNATMFNRSAHTTRETEKPVIVSVPILSDGQESVVVWQTPSVDATTPHQMQSRLMQSPPKRVWTNTTGQCYMWDTKDKELQ